MSERDWRGPEQKTIFGPLHIVPPRTEHTHTIILLHGRGSTGKDFYDELMESNLSDGLNLQQKLPECRWVFPSSRSIWSTAFQEAMPGWFEAHSLTDIAARQDLQVDGIRDSVEYILKIIEDEIGLLHGASEKLTLGGISHGGAVGLWALSHQAYSARPLGGFIGASTWLPFATSIEKALALGRQSVKEDQYFSALADLVLPSGKERPASLTSFGPTRVFLGHGGDDAYVDVELGRHAARVMVQYGLDVEWKEYLGAEEEGHWLKEPEQLDDMHSFLRRLIS